MTMQLQFRPEENNPAGRAYERSLRLTRSLCWIGLVISLAGLIVIGLITQSGARSLFASVTYLFAMAAYTCGLISLRQGFNVWAKVILMATALTQLTIYTYWTGIGTGVHIFLFLPFVAARLIFLKGKAEMFCRYSVLGLCPALFIFLELAFMVWGLQPVFPPLGTSAQNVLICFNGLVTMGTISLTLFLYSRAEGQFVALIDANRQQAESLLLNMVPEPIAARLRSGEKLIADRHEEVTVLFADLSNFTTVSTYISAERLVGFLNDLFSQFDTLAGQWGVEKIKTIGDNYMLVAGLPFPQPDHAARAVEVALKMQRITSQWAKQNNLPLGLRIGRTQCRWLLV